MPFDLRGWCRHYEVHRCRIHLSKGPDGGSAHLLKPSPAGNRPDTLVLAHVQPVKDSAGQQRARLEVTTWTPDLCRVAFERDVPKWDDDVLFSMMLAGMSFTVELPDKRAMQFSQLQWLNQRTDDIARSPEFGEFGFRPPVAFRRMESFLREEWARCMDISYNAAVASIKECFAKYQDRMSEEQVLQWFREATVRHVLES